MTKYNLEDFQSWLNEERNQELKASGAISWEWYINKWRKLEVFDQTCQEFRNRPPHKAKPKVEPTVLKWMDEVDQREQNTENNMNNYRKDFQA